MNKAMMVITALLSLSLLAEEVDAKRLGGGRSIGRQRDTITQPAPKSPAQQAPSAAPTNPTQQPQPSGMSKWLGPLAGLALGAGLAALFMNNGLAGAIGGILMILLIVAAAMFAWRMLRPKPQSQPLQYAGAGAPASREQGSRLRDATVRESGAALSSAGVASVSGVTSPKGTPVPPFDGAPGGQSDISTAFGGGASAPAAAANRYPPGFDAEQFVRHAKLNFTRLQAANDQRDLSTMRDFMTPEMYAAIAADTDVHGNEKTDVVTLNAEVLEVVTEGDVYIASVRFSGMICERADGAAEPFSEVWHLEKPINGSTGWLICGIQQD